MRYFAASSSPLRGNPTHCSRGSKKNFWRRCRGGSRKSRFDSRQRAISGAVAGEVYAKVKIPSTHHNPYLPYYIICHLPLIFLSPQFMLAVLFALSLSILPLFLYLPLFARFLFAHMVRIVVYLLLNREPKIYGSSSTC